MEESKWFMLFYKKYFINEVRMIKIKKILSFIEITS